MWAEAIFGAVSVDLANRDWLAALRKVYSILRVSPRHLQALRLAERAFSGSQQQTLAKACCLRILESLPEDREILARLAEFDADFQKKQQERDREPRIELVNALLDQKETHQTTELPLSHADLAYYYWMGGLANQAIAELKASLREEPGKIADKLQLIRYALDSDRFEEVKDQIDEILATLPWHLEALQLKQEWCQKTDQLETSIDVRMRLLQLGIEFEDDCGTTAVNHDPADLGFDEDPDWSGFPWDFDLPQEEQAVGFIAEAIQDPFIEDEEQDEVIVEADTVKDQKDEEAQASEELPPSTQPANIPQFILERHLKMEQPERPEENESTGSLPEKDDTRPEKQPTDFSWIVDDESTSQPVFGEDQIADGETIFDPDSAAETHVTKLEWEQPPNLTPTLSEETHLEFQSGESADPLKSGEADLDSLPAWLLQDDAAQNHDFTEVLEAETELPIPEPAPKPAPESMEWFSMAEHVESASVIDAEMDPSEWMLDFDPRIDPLSVSLNEGNTSSHQDHPEELGNSPASERSPEAESIREGLPAWLEGLELPEDESIGSGSTSAVQDHLGTGHPATVIGDLPSEEATQPNKPLPSGDPIEEQPSPQVDETNSKPAWINELMDESNTAPDSLTPESTEGLALEESNSMGYHTETQEASLADRQTEENDSSSDLPQFQAKLLEIQNRLAGEEPVQELIKELTDLADEFPDKPEIWATLGDALRKSGDLPAALDAYAKSEKLS